MFETLGWCQATEHSEPALGVAEEGEIEPTQTLQGHARTPNHEITLGWAVARSVPRADVKRCSAPFGEHFDWIVERPPVSGAHREAACELFLDPLLRPAIDLRSQFGGNSGQNPFMRSTAAWTDRARSTTRRHVKGGTSSGWTSLIPRDFGRQELLKTTIAARPDERVGKPSKLRQRKTEDAPIQRCRHSPGACCLRSSHIPATVPCVRHPSAPYRCPVVSRASSRSSALVPA